MAVGYCGTIVIGVPIFVLDLPIASVFFVAAALYGLFAIPLFLVVREPAPPPGTPEPGLRDAIAALGQLRATILDARTVPGLARFLVGRFFYSDAVNTIIVVMAIVATEAMGLTNTVANLILLALAIVAVASFGWGWAVDRLGPKRTLMIVLSSWAIGLVVGGISLGVEGKSGSLCSCWRGGPWQRAWRRPGLRPRADAALATREARRVLRALRARGQGLAGHRAAAVRRDPVGLPAGAGRGRYQLAVLSLLATMLIGAWLIRPVSDRWTGSGELAAPRPDAARTAGAGLGTDRATGRRLGSPAIPASGAVAARVRPAPVQRRADDLVE